MRNLIIALAMLFVFMGTAIIYYGFYSFIPSASLVFMWLCATWVFMSLTQGVLNRRRN